MNPTSVKKIGVLGMSLGGIDGQIMQAFLRARGANRLWRIRDVGHTKIRMEGLIEEYAPADAVCGRFHDSNIVDILQEAAIPMIDFADRLNDDRLTVISPDLGLVGQMAADFLVERGFNRFGYYPYKRDPFNERQFDAFGERLAEHGFYRDDAQRPGDIARNVQHALDHGQHYAMLAANDRTASELSDNLRVAGFSVPEQVAILGVDNTTLFCESAVPTLSSIMKPTQEMGRLAVEMLAKFFDGVPMEQGMTRLAPIGVFERGSTAFTSVTDPLISRSLQIIREQSTNGLNTIDLAAQLGLKRTTFGRRFKRVTGESPADAIHRTRVEAARRMLITTSELILNIALDCGYRDAEQFAKHFRRAHGTTPSEYRKRRVARLNSPGLGAIA